MSTLDSRAREQVLSDLPTVGLGDAIALLNSDHDTIERMKVDGSLLVLVTDKGEMRIPSFQLSEALTIEERCVIIWSNRLLNAARYPWSTGSWWSSPNGNVGGSPRPVDLIAAGRPGLVYSLAEIASLGPDL